MEQVSALTALALRLLPWLGMVMGLILLGLTESSKPFPGHGGRRWIKAIAVALIGMSIGALAAVF
jgi:hypothetical protein